MVSFFLYSCGGSPDSGGSTNRYEVGGNVYGLRNSGLILQNNGGNDLAISANSSSFVFPAGCANEEGYNITVKSQPEMQFCMITQGSGTISGASVTNVSVDCSGTMHMI